MSVDNRISQNLSSDQQAQILAHLDALCQDLEWTLSLSPTDRARLSHAAEGTEAFLMQSLQLGQQYPAILPRGMSIDEMAKDMSTRSFLMSIRSRLASLHQRVEDTISICGSEAYQAGLTVYRGARTYGEDLGLDTQVQELSKRFKRTTRASQTETPSGQ